MTMLWLTIIYIVSVVLDNGDSHAKSHPYKYIIILCLISAVIEYTQGLSSLNIILNHGYTYIVILFSH